MKSGSRGRVVLSALAGALVLVAGACQTPTDGGAATTTTTSTTPPDPVDEPFLSVPIIGDLSAPTNVEFTPDGRVFVAEQSGVVVTFDSITDPTPTVAADLRDAVRSTGDHGLLGMAVDPQWPTRPYLYLLSTWDVTGLWGDGCAAGYAVNGCLSGGRVSRLTLDGSGQMVGAPDTIVEDRWCYQFTSHGVGDLDFLADGTMIAASGEGSWVGGVDYGQRGGTPVFPPVPNTTPVNPCGDPPNGVGGPVSPVTSEGGAFRAQDLLTDGDPVSWDGALVRFDPDTGEAPADNPLVGDGSADDDHILAHGHRNPFRFAVRPGTNEVYVADVGQNKYEEIHKVDVDDGSVPNFGWPCQEGAEPSPQYSALNNQLCDLARSPGARTSLTDPWFSYSHDGAGASLAGISFIPPGRYPSEYDGSLIFSDYVRGETYALGIAADGSPAPQGPSIVATGGIPVDLEAGPDGYVYSVDYIAGTVERFIDRDSAPVARLAASATSGALPLTVDLDASASTGPAGETLSYAWDLDGDGDFDDAIGPTAQATFTASENVEVAVEVSDPALNASTASETIFAGNTPPSVEIDVTSPLPWSANDDISFLVDAIDVEDGTIPVDDVSWEAQINHCYTPEDCHVHPYTGASGSAGSVITGPSHGYPSFLTLIATAVDARGQTTTVTRELQPEAVTLEVTSTPPGATVTVGETTGVTPFTLQVIRNDSVSISAPSPQQIDGVPHVFGSWSTGAPASHDYEVGPTDTTLELVMVPQ